MSSNPVICMSKDAIIYMAISSYLHYYDLCLLGLCFEHRDYKRYHLHRVSLASYMFFFVASILASFFTWWPEKLGTAPSGLMNIVYKSWIAMMLYNFTERLIWFALYESVSYLLEYTSISLNWLAELLHVNYEACNNFIEMLKCDCFHQLALSSIVLYAFYSFVVLKGCLTISEKLKMLISKHLCGENQATDKENQATDKEQDQTLRKKRMTPSM